MSGENAYSGELAGPSRKDSVGEDADEEGREDVEQTGVGRPDRLSEDCAPGECAHNRGHEVETYCSKRPRPAHGRECVSHLPPVRAVNDEQNHDACRRGRDKSGVQEPRLAHQQPSVCRSVYWLASSWALSPCSWVCWLAFVWAL